MAKTILLADDSSTIRRIVELTFSDTRFRVEAVDSGAAAIERMTTLDPDLVLADVAMPAPTGYEICRAIKQSARPVPVLLLAGTFEPFDAAYAERCGADGHLVKPFESETLRRKVEQLLSPAAESAAPAAEPASGEEPPEPTAADAPVPEVEAPEAEPETPATPAEASPPTIEGVSPELVDAVARAVVEKLSTDVLRQIAWEVVPDLATVIIRERIRELEREDS